MPNHLLWFGGRTIIGLWDSTTPFFISQVGRRNPCFFEDLHNSAGSLGIWVWSVASSEEQKLPSRWKVQSLCPFSSLEGIYSQRILRRFQVSIDLIDDREVSEAFPIDIFLLGLDNFRRIDFGWTVSLAIPAAQTGKHPFHQRFGVVNLPLQDPTGYGGPSPGVGRLKPEFFANRTNPKGSAQNLFPAPSTAEAVINLLFDPFQFHDFSSE